MKQCRIVVTEKCNLTCPYCVMQDEEVRKTFKPLEIKDIKFEDYSTFLITFVTTKLFVLLNFFVSAISTVSPTLTSMHAGL